MVVGGWTVHNSPFCIIPRQNFSPAMSSKSQSGPKTSINEPLGWVLLFNSIMAGVLISLHFGKNALPS